MKRELILNALPQEIRIALLEDGLPAEIFIERTSRPGILGNVYLGRVSNVLPGMQSAFVDIGGDRDAFLYVNDLLPGGDPEEVPAVEADGPRPVRRGPPIESLVREGQPLMVQVVKEVLGSKGPRVTSQISLPGRSLVFLPLSNHRAVSRRIDAEAERERLRRMVESLPGPGGFIVRTAAGGADAEALAAEAEGLRQRWEEILRLAEAQPAPARLHAETDLSLKIVRDLLTPEVDRILIDREEVYDRCREFAERQLPVLASRVERYSREEGIFEAFGVEKELQRALRRRVWLPSGGYIVIHPTEALVAIDVNTGKYVGTSRFEQTALKTNLEAVREVVRQIRLRDLGGILVVDFIDLEEEENRRSLAAALEEELRKDRAKSRVLQISEFGLVEITRQRVRGSLDSLLGRACPTCRGSGRVRSPETLCFDIEREVRKVLPLLVEGAEIRVRAHPEVASLFQDGLAALQAELGRSGVIRIRVEGIEEFHPEQVEIETG